MAGQLELAIVALRGDRDRVVLAGRESRHGFRQLGCHGYAVDKVDDLGKFLAPCGGRRRERHLGRLADVWLSEGINPAGRRPIGHE